MKLLKPVTMVAILIGLLLVGCTNTQQNTNTTPTVDLQAHDDGYPIALPTTDETVGYPIETYTPIVVPEVTPNETTGVVRGTILYQGRPVVGYNLYLADLVTDDQGVETTAVLRRTESPQAMLGVGGEFAFIEVPPQRYALMFYNGVGSFLLLNPNSAAEEAIIVEVAPGELIDLGELNFQDLPIDLP